MKHKHHSKNARAIIALLILAIVFVLFYKFLQYKDDFLNDPIALRNYVIFTILGGGFLIGLLYLSSQATEEKASPKAKKTVASKKRKK